MASALITGGTSGIGLAFAQELARRGTNLILVARDTVRLEAVAAELNGQFGVEVETIQADLSERADMLRIGERLEDLSRPVDILVNNAGFGLHSTSLNPDEVELNTNAIEVMCVAVFILSGSAARAMKTRGHGQIITVASSSSSIFSGNYSAIKAWARTFSNSLALELSGTGVTATALLPGWVKTEFHQRAGINASKLPGIVWIDADKLVRTALDDSAKGRFESVPDWKWKTAMFLADHGPRAFTRWFSKKLSASRKH
ncbi:SDR family oxidoreductase [Tessaracoccus sp. ZS01]|uniref:SDR family NAD(P)-dependent oxidoreductase n=1 Tax=Tessaracoccus sp. ZS01 TaxID=1906324 RepID=UPI00096CC438|nr:SDR family NAD(P)-dependent oxidoreductase [Tessaracoccus sp. ZS01]MCG6567548.1 KR domain-containing protein [Tessaracoccus sp. ZS01]OMG55912.1 short-chain dehydrogenase [Tessaracoccus sp. ZS01]